ncbi:MAG TPA: hypothetical protein VNP96_10605 [Solirubrobacterales bacterium]|nr:hypothetical protein [Solirubrobacterales bacterium]
MRTYAAVAVFALGAAGALSACGDDEESTATTARTTDSTNTPSGAQSTTPEEPATPTIVVRGGKPVGGVTELDYEAGEQVRFTVRSNTADEVHIHGYDVSKEIPAGGSATISFPADIEGIFEGELHGSGEQIVELRVEP